MGSIAVGVHADDAAPQAGERAPPAHERAPPEASATVVEQRAAPATQAFEATPVEPAAMVPAEPLSKPPRTLWDIVKGLPILIYTPETSAGFGAGLLFQFDMPGAQVDRRPSSVTVGGLYTLRGQIMGQLTPELRFGDDAYVLKLDVQGAKFPNHLHGVGNDVSLDKFDRYTDCYLRGELDFRMRPSPSRESALRPLFVGAHVTSGWTSVRDPEPAHADQESVFEELTLRGEEDLYVMGTGASVAWDSRDSLSWPNFGDFIEAKATFFDPVLGSDLRFRRFTLDARHYQPLWLDHVLALRFVTQAVWGEVPFQRLPQLGGASLFRGWYGGQLRDRLLMAIEAEYRLPLSKRWALVAFGSAGRVARNIKELDPRGIHLAGGGGLRFSVDKRDRVNIRVDAAYGGAFYPYLQFREAF